MNALIKWLENSFAPKMSKVNNNIWVVTLKDSIMQTLPFIFLGSIFCCLAIIEDFVTLPFSFWTPFGWTMSKISLLVAFLIPFNYCEKKRYRKQRLIAGLTGMLLFMMVVTPEFIADGTVGFGHDSLGAGGMFVAILTGIVASVIFGAFAKFSFFKDDSAVPDFVRQWFDALLPIGLTVVIGWVIVLILNVDIYKIIVNLFMPLQNGLNTLPGFTFFMFFTCFIYSMGISSWVLTPIGQPVRLASITTNLALVAAGTATASNILIYTEGLVYCTYMWVGGIAWNPYLMVPMWLQGIIIPILTYVFTKIIALAPLPHVQFELWYAPYPIGTIMNIMSQGAGALVRALIFLVVSVAVSSAIWYPFFKAYETKRVQEEQEKIAAK